MAMKNKISEFFKKKIEIYLPSEEPETEEERLYEEGKKRLYDLHMAETDLFYVDNIWIEDERVHVYGEFARGDFVEGQMVEFLDNYAEHILCGKVEQILDERPDSVQVKRGFFKTEPKMHLILNCGNLESCKESYMYTNFLIKMGKV